MVQLQRAPKVSDRWMWELLLQDQHTPYAALVLLGQGRFRPLAQDPALNRLYLLRHLQHCLDSGHFSSEMLSALVGLQAVAAHLQGSTAWRPVVPSAELYGRVRLEIVVQHLRKDSSNWPAFVESLKELFPESIPDTDEEAWEGGQRSAQDLWALRANPSPAAQEKLAKRHPRPPVLAELHTFLEEAWRAVGPAFLQQVAADVSSGRYQIGAGPGAGAGVPPGAAVTMRELLASFPARKGQQGLEGPPGVQPQRSKKRRFSGGGPAEVPARAALAEEEAMPDLPSPDREDAHPSSRPAPNAAAVVGDLRVSSQALRLIGQDPLPAALAQAGGARSTRKGTRAAAAEAAREAGGADGGGQGAIPEAGEAAEEPSPATLAERAAARGKAKVSLMDRQEGARTLQWTEEEEQDPIESTPDEGEQAPRLPASEPREPVPTKIRKGRGGNTGSAGKTGKPRRETNPWRAAEEEALIKGVREFGEGKWKRILTEYSDVFVRRTGVDLKDKWRTRSKHHLDFQDHPSDQE